MRSKLYILVCIITEEKQMHWKQMSPEMWPQLDRLVNAVCQQISSFPNPGYTELCLGDTLIRKGNICDPK